jgi:hypothetical protein
VADLGTIGQKGNLAKESPDQSAAASSEWFFSAAEKGNLVKERPDQSASFTSEWTFSAAEKGHLVFAKAQSAGNESAWDLIGGERGNLAWGSTPPILGFIAQQGLLTFNRLEQAPAMGGMFLTATAQKGLLVFSGVNQLTPPPLPPNTIFGLILRDELAGDTVLLPADDPVLETGDHHYGNLNMEKETDAMMPNASWAVGASLKVQVHGRQYLSDAVNFNEADATVGNWVPTLPEGKLTFNDKKRYGRVLRYRFVGVGLRFLHFDAYAVNVYSRGAER